MLPDTSINWLTENAGISADLQQRVLVSIAIILVLIIARRMLIRYIDRHIREDARLNYRWHKISAYITVALGVLLVGPRWLQGIQSLATLLGLASAGLAIALRDPVTDLAGWLFIIGRRPFEVGDRVEINGDRGDVVDIRLFQFSILEIGNWVQAEQSTGRVIHLPNKLVFSDALANYTAGFDYIWHEIAVLVTFESDWRAAKGIVQDIADQHSDEHIENARRQIRAAAGQFMITYSTLTPTVYTRVLESGVLLTIRMLCDVRKRRTLEHAVWEEILTAFAERDNVDFAYPTQRFITTKGDPPATES